MLSILARGRRVIATALATLALLAGEAVTADERPVPVGVELAHALPDSTAEAIAARLRAALCGSDPTATLRSGIADRLALGVVVRPVSATTLRGFWLPFSGVYAVGALRLAVERMVAVPGVPRPVPAVVWQGARPVGGPWRTAGQEIMRRLDELTAELLATGPELTCRR